MECSQVKEVFFNQSIQNTKLITNYQPFQYLQPNSQHAIHLRKSKIANIPETKNINLSNKLDFVVVFQTIEIQRMANQIQALRISKKQYQSRLFNASNYEIQIKQLTDRCFRLENQNRSFQQDLLKNIQEGDLLYYQLEELNKKHAAVDLSANQKYQLQKSRNQQLLNQIEKWKNRYYTLEQSKERQFKSIKQVMQQQSYNRSCRQNKQLLLKFELQKQKLESFIKNQKQQNLKQQALLKKTIFQLNFKNQLQQSVQKQADNYQQQLAQLSKQNLRLFELSESKIQELKRLKDSIQHHEDIVAKITQNLTTKSTEIKVLICQQKKFEEIINQKQEAFNKMQKCSLIDKQRLVEFDRIVLQLKQKDKQIEYKSRNIQKKDKKIQVLEEQIKQLESALIATKTSINTLKLQILESSQTINQLIKRIQYLSNLNKIIKKSTHESVQSVSSSYASFINQVNKKTTHIIDQSQQLMVKIHHSPEHIVKLENISKINADKIRVLENQKIDYLQRIENMRVMEIKFDNLKEQNTKLKAKVKDLVLQNKEIIKRYDIEFQAKEEKLKIFFQSRQTEYDSKTKFFSRQLKQLKQLLSKEQKKNQQFKQSFEEFSIFYQSTKYQLEALFSRITPIQNLINILKSMLLEKLSKNQNKFAEKQNTFSTKINQLLDMNFRLMEKHQKIYNSILENKFDIRLEKKDQKKFCKVQNDQQTRTSKGEEERQNLNFMARANESEKSFINEKGKQSSLNIPEDHLVKRFTVCAELESLNQKINGESKRDSMKNSMIVNSNVIKNRNFDLDNDSEKVRSQNILLQKVETMLESSIMQYPLINIKTKNFTSNIVSTLNNSQPHVSKRNFVKNSQKKFRGIEQFNIKKTESSQKYTRRSEDGNYSSNNQNFEIPENQNPGIYTNRITITEGLIKKGFESKKLKIYNQFR